MEITGYSVTHLYHEVKGWAKVAPKETIDSRVGKCYTLLEPLTICNRAPKRRALFNKQRNANPFFHLMECIWMFSGAEDDWIIQFNRNMASYMEPNGLFHGAYGYRWINHFARDQISAIIAMLKKDPMTRRAYLGIWDPEFDLNPHSLDLPCNVGMSIQIRGGKLNGYVFNRSNDIMWGMIGTNCVHFSMLLEIISDCIGIPMGSLYQTTCNPHVYEQHWHLLEDNYNYDPGEEPASLDLGVEDWQTWSDDCQEFLRRDMYGTYSHIWFNTVAVPMFRAYIHHEHEQVYNVAALDWQEAARQWLATNRSFK